MQFVLDKNSLVELYMLSRKLGPDFNPFASFGNKHDRPVVLFEVFNEIPRGNRNEIEHWLEKNGVKVENRLLAKSLVQENHPDYIASRQQFRTKFFKKPNSGANRKTQQIADLAMYQYMHEKRGQSVTLISNDRDWIDYARRVNGKMINSSHVAMPGLFTHFLNEVINGRFDRKLFTDHFEDFLSSASVPSEYSAYYQATKEQIKNIDVKKVDISTARQEILDGFLKEIEANAKRVNGKLLISSKELRQLNVRKGGTKVHDFGTSIAAAGTGLELVRHVSGPLEAVDFLYTVNEFQRHLANGNDEEALKTVTSYTASLATGAAIGALAAAGVAGVAGAVGVTVGAVPLLLTGVVLSTIGGMVAADQAEKLTQDFVDHLVEKHGAEEFTLDLLVAEARSYFVGGGHVDEERFEDAFSGGLRYEIQRLEEVVDLASGEWKDAFTRELKARQKSNGGPLSGGQFSRFVDEFKTDKGILNGAERSYAYAEGLDFRYPEFLRLGPEEYEKKYGVDFIEEYGQYFIDHNTGQPLRNHMHSETADYLFVADPVSGVRQIIVPRDAIDASPVTTIDGLAGEWKAVAVEGGTALYEPETGAYRGFIPNGALTDFQKRQWILAADATLDELAEEFPKSGRGRGASRKHSLTRKRLKSAKAALRDVIESYVEENGNLPETAEEHVALLAPILDGFRVENGGAPLSVEEKTALADRWGSAMAPDTGEQEDTGTGQSGKPPDSVDVEIDGTRHPIRFDPDEQINFWGKTLRLGDEINGDPDVGDVSYYPGDEDGNLEAGEKLPLFRSVMLAEVLFRDGVYINGEGQIIRASHGQPADTLHDRMIEIVPAARGGQVPDPEDRHRSRVGQRFIADDGQDGSIGEVALMAHSGFDRSGALVHLSGARRTFKWTVYDHPPLPWSYVMQANGHEPNRYAPPREPAKSGWQAWREANGLAEARTPEKPPLPKPAASMADPPLRQLPERQSTMVEYDAGQQDLPETSYVP